MFVSTLLVTSLAAATGTAQQQQQQLTRQKADQFTAKLVQIAQTGQAKPRGTAVARTTQITDDEVNAYFRHHAKEQIPVGVVDPTIHAMGNGRLTGRALVDLDAVRQQKERGLLDPMGYMTGRVPVTATGTLTTSNGVGQFTLESAEIAGITVPKRMLQELLSYYSKTPENPAGLDMDAPFELPANIREIRVGKAHAVVVQ